MKNPKIEVEITEQGIDVNLYNWDGVTNMTIERVHYAIVKRSQVYRAEQLGKMHAENMMAVAAIGSTSIQDVQPVVAPVEEKGQGLTIGVTNFIKEIANVLTK